MSRMGRVLLITSLAAAAFLACQTGPCLAEEKLPDGARADRVVVMKKERTLSLLVHGKIMKTGGRPGRAKDEERRPQDTGGHLRS
jgi:hypothetical protein